MIESKKLIKHYGDMGVWVIWSWGRRNIRAFRPRWRWQKYRHIYDMRDFKADRGAI